MTDNTSNRMPVLLGIIAALLLAGAGGYLLARPTPTKPGEQKIASASADASKAVADAGMSDKERGAIEALVRSYILEHPEILSDAAEILQQRETAKRLAAAGGALTKPFPGAESGNPSGDVTVVEFTDYSCGYCRASVADLNRLVAGDKNVRVIYRELPILAPISREAALWGLAAAKQGKHKAFHDAMFSGGRPDPNTIRAAASRAGMNIAQAEAYVRTSEAAAEIDNNLKMMQQIGFNGTPTFVVGDQLLEGAMGHDALKAAVEKARKKA